ncbi:MAG: sialidase [Gemmatimonadota bacterium]|nr:sialidase [Gemmatimonadota bacterium]
MRASQHPLARRVLGAAAVLLVFAPLAAVAQQVSADALRPLTFRHIGPVGNRVSSVSGVVGDPLTYYVGAATGGVWKTSDGGTTWAPIFDDQESHAAGALAVSMSDPAVVWVGTGEPHIRSNVSVGDGVYKSTDAGRTWANMGLRATGRISRVVIHPTNPDIVFIASLGHAHAPQRERGIYRTRDGGRTWEQVLFVNENVGASSLVMDPNNPRILFAGMWEVSVNTWGRESGGPGSGIFMSRDGGDTWTRLQGRGLPRLPVGKIDVCMTPADSRRIYALIETGDGVPWKGQPTESGELWRSDNGGESWRMTTNDRNFGGRTAYYNQCRVSTDDPNEAYFLTASFVKSIDGGLTGQPQGGGRSPGGDNHDMWIDPHDGARMIVGNDGGVGISRNRGETWHRVQLPIAQMYHVTADNAIPYHVMGNRQDGPSSRGPSNSLYGNQIARGDWHGVGGGESGFATPDPKDPNIVWSSASGSGARGGIVVRFNERNRQVRDVEVWPQSTGGWPAESLLYRFQWTFPLLISPHDNNTLYVTSQVVHRTTNGGQSWQVISPDLTTNDKSRQKISGGLTPDNIGVEYCCVIYAFDESPAQQGVFYAGSNDGRVHVSRDNGANWVDVTANLPGAPKDGVVRGIDASKWSAGKAYLVIEGHEVGDFKTYAYRTTDFGRTWKPIVAGIPAHPLSFTRSIQEDPVKPGLLYLGTENRIYVSFNDGDLWQPLVNNMPPTPIYDLKVQPHFHDLLVGTYGRGFWIMDDLTPLQQMTPQVAAEAAHLFKPRDAYRFRGRTSPMAMSNDMTVGQNPAYGASINYWLGAAPSGTVTIRIADATGATVRTLTGTRNQGLNRVYWDLEDNASLAIKLRTTPLYADWVDLGPDRVRSGGNGITILQPPGTYTVSLEVGGRTLTQPLVVLKDPNSEGTEADIAVQVAMLRRMRTDHDSAATAINRIEWTRRQLLDMEAILKDQGGAGSAEILRASAGLTQKLIAVEEHLTQLRSTGTGQDGVRYPAQVSERLRYLIGSVGTADFRPTDQGVEVHAVLKKELDEARQNLTTILANDLPALNRMLQARNLPGIIMEAADTDP